MAKMTHVDETQLHGAVSVASNHERAFISKSTGDIRYPSLDDLGPLDDASADFLQVPTWEDLGIRAREMALRFTARSLPAEADAVSAMFDQRGAMQAFKAHLDARGKTAEWHEYEDEAQKGALRSWAADNGFQLTQG